MEPTQYPIQRVLQAVPSGAKWPKLEKTTPLHLLPGLRMNEVTVNFPHTTLWYVQL
jgi:hypothetical protein